MLGKTFSRQDEECCQRYFPAKMMLFSRKAKNVDRESREAGTELAMGKWRDVDCGCSSGPTVVAAGLLYNYIVPPRMQFSCSSSEVATRTIIHIREYTLTRVCKCVHICVSSYRQPESGCQS